MQPRSALEQGLTVIQGPPGSGKSEVIFALLVSAVMAGKSVLFSAKNHQAVDEVEKRLKAVVPDFPILTRARDAEGERDVSFLDALHELAHEDTQNDSAQRQEIDAVTGSLHARASDHHDWRRKGRDGTALHLALSELVERRDLIGKHPRSPARASARPKVCFTEF